MLKVDKSSMDTILSSIQKDTFWDGHLNHILLPDPLPFALHLAIFIEPYLQYILNGQKTVESRFSTRRYAPYQQVEAGDIIFLKQSSGPIVGLCEVGSAWFYQLDPASLGAIKKEFTQALCAQDPNFWEKRKKASYATLMRIRYVHKITPIKYDKRDRRGWVVLKPREIQKRLIE
jgi:hypothetical protein